MSQVFDLRGNKRNWMPADGRSDPHHPDRSRMDRDAEKFAKLKAAAIADGQNIDPQVMLHEQSVNWLLEHDETDSPIEKHLLAAMIFGHELVNDRFAPVALLRDQKPIFGARCIQVAPQFRVGVYRLDFAIILAGPQYLGRIAVECDGHEFHSLTKEQASHDRMKDRALATAGWPVLRFTGSEIAQDVEACTKEIRAALNGLMRDQLSAFEHGRKWERDHA